MDTKRFFPVVLLVLSGLLLIACSGQSFVSAAKELTLEGIEYVSGNLEVKELTISHRKNTLPAAIEAPAIKP